MFSFFLLALITTSFRSSEKGTLRNCAKFPGKHLCQSLFFNKVAGLRPATLLKNSLWHRCFPANFAKFPRTPFLTEHLQCLFFSVQTQTEMVEEWWSERLYCHMYFPQNNQFLH